jgi:hypothetical protein
MRKYIHIILFLIGLVISVVFYYERREFIAYLLFTMIYSWNIFAFLNEKRMIRFPMMVGDFTPNGDRAARGFLCVLSFFLLVLLSAAYIYKRFAE